MVEFNFFERFFCSRRKRSELLFMIVPWVIKHRRNVDFLCINFFQFVLHDMIHGIPQSSGFGNNVHIIITTMISKHYFQGCVSAFCGWHARCPPVMAPRRNRNQIAFTWSMPLPSLPYYHFVPAFYPKRYWNVRRPIFRALIIRKWRLLNSRNVGVCRSDWSRESQPPIDKAAKQEFSRFAFPEIRGHPSNSLFHLKTRAERRDNCNVRFLLAIRCWRIATKSLRVKSDFI